MFLNHTTPHQAVPHTHRKANMCMNDGDRQMSSERDRQMEIYRPTDGWTRGDEDRRSETEMRRRLCWLHIFDFVSSCNLFYDCSRWMMMHRLLAWLA